MKRWHFDDMESIGKTLFAKIYKKRRYFPDEMIDQLHLSDRILQHILLKQLKPTISHVTNPNCVHVYGPLWC